jgi:tRNA threonylcarbamoyladenosine biosynthesis protein TsaB
MVFNLKTDGGRRISPAIREIMKDLSLAFSELSAIGVSHGPGSFTGLRIGVATAKTLAHANDIPLYAVNSLLLLAVNAAPADNDVCPVLDARKGEVYTALYRFRGEGIEEKMKPTVLSPRELLDILPDSAVMVGEGAHKYRELFKGGYAKTRDIAPSSQSQPRASSLSALIHSGAITAQVEDIMNLEPLYIRRPEAELKWQEKSGATD